MTGVGSPKVDLQQYTISDPSTVSLFLISNGFMRTSGLKKQVRPAPGRTENGKQLIGHSYTDTVIQSSPVSPAPTRFSCRRHRRSGGTCSKRIVVVGWHFLLSGSDTDGECGGWREVKVPARILARLQGTKSIDRPNSVPAARSRCTHGGRCISARNGLADFPSACLMDQGRHRIFIPSHQRQASLFIRES